MEFDKGPYWYKLIKLLKAKNVITAGLAIPYLFGAYKVLDEPFKVYRVNSENDMGLKFDSIRRNKVTQLNGYNFY